MRILPVVIVLVAMFNLHVSSHAQDSCSTYKFDSNQVFGSCTDLPYLNSFLHWDYDPASSTVKMAYRHTGDSSSSRWVAWAINPNSQGMVGCQALVAYQKSDGTMRVYTTAISNYQTPLQEGDLSFTVSDLSASRSRNEITIFATLRLDNLTTTVNQVWQEGPLSSDSPTIHSTSGSNVQSMGTLDLTGGSGTVAGAMNLKTKKKNIHGVLNAISWGLMMPLGAMFARYLKMFPAAGPVWFYLHSTCQTSSYILGVVGWATGLRLGSQSPGVQYTSHRNIGIILFSIGTLQASALLLRPKKDHKHRVYWNIYHHVIGYSIIILGITNVFKGFGILDPEEKWKTIYIGILVGLAFVAAILEVYLWCTMAKRNKLSNNPNPKMNNEVNAANGNRGYGQRARDRV